MPERRPCASFPFPHNTFMMQNMRLVFGAARQAMTLSLAGLGMVMALPVQTARAAVEAETAPLLDKGRTLLAKLRAFAAGTEAEITLEPGRYPLPKEGLLLRKLKGRTLHAEGVTLVGTDLNSALLRFEECTDVTVTGLTLDYDPLPFTQGRLTKVDHAARTAEFEISQGYPPLDEVYLEEKNVHLFEKDRQRWKPDVPDYYPKKIERLTPTAGRLVFSAQAAGVKELKEGDRLVLNVRRKQGVSVEAGCAGLTLRDVTIHAAPGIGILVRFAEEAGTFENVRITPGPKPPGAVEERLFSTSADGFNAAYVRKGPVLKNCDFSFMGDDAVNLHGVMLPVVKWLDAQSFVSMRAHWSERFDRLIRAGDEVRFLKEPTYAVAARARVVKVDYLKGGEAPYEADVKKIWPTLKEAGKAAFYVVHLDQAVEGVSAGDFCDVPATSAPGFAITGCHFHDHRARGLRLMSNDGVVLDNTFERLKGVAITVGPEYAFWREAGWCRDIRIQGNRIRDVGQGINVRLPASYTPGAITVMGRVEPQKAATRYYPGNENITITSNEIDGCAVNGITVYAAKGVKVTGNVLKRVNTVQAPDMAADYGLARQEAISVQQAEAVELEGNRVENVRKN